VKLQPHHLLVVEQEATARGANGGIASASIAAAAAAGATASGTTSSGSSASRTSTSAAAPAEQVRYLLSHAPDLVDDALGLLHHAANLLDSAADALENVERALGLVALELLVQLHERAQTPAARAGASGVTTRR